MWALHIGGLKMRILHNISALNAERRLEQNMRNVASSLSNLSSGLRINKSADDAAGLAISEKMRAQIRGLEQAERNTQDGISLVQTAEGGLSNIHEQLHRARELTVQAANDTLTRMDRAEIQKEIEEIKNGINDIANHTEFNTIPLLNGANPNGYNRNPNGNYNFENALSLNVSSDGSLDLRTNVGYPGTIDDDSQVLIFGSGNTSRPSLIIDNTSYALKSNVTQSTSENNGVFTTVSTVNNVEVTQTVKIVNDKYEFRYSINNNSSVPQEIGFYFHMDVMLGDDDAAPFLVDNTAITNEESYIGTNVPNSFNVYNNSGNPDVKAEGIIKGTSIIEDPTELRIGQYSDVSNALGWTDTDEPVGDSGYGLLWGSRTVAANGSFEVNTFYGLGVPPTIADSLQVTESGPYDLTLQVGANSGNHFKVQLSDVRTTSLKIDDIEVDPYAKAMEALTKLDGAISTVSSERSKYGAYQNGLEHISENVSNSTLNLTSAESRIRDIDMAKELMEQTKSSMLSQVSQTILAQANQQPEAILQLMKN
jgi:flagellin